MTEQTNLASAIAAAQAAFEADELVQGTAAGTPGRRERMAQIIHAIAAEWEVERVDLTMALTQASVRPN
jgi:hypothetical protein